MTQADVNLCIAVVAVVLVILVCAFFACIALAWDLSREEERAMVLKPCPVCHKVPHLGYCCGEYYVSGDDRDCPGCGTAFTEMHSSPELEIDAWNRRAENGTAED